MSTAPAVTARVQPELGLRRPTLDRHVRAWLRIEGLAVLVAAAFAYFRLGGEWLWFLPALLAPDLSGLGYLRGPRIGAVVYDLFHNWAIGLAVLGVGLATAVPVVTLAGTILIAHTGMDRSVGYGLKLMTGFHDTHLGRKGGNAKSIDVDATSDSMAPAAARG
jgi:hypothetical protein